MSRSLAQKFRQLGGDRTTAVACCVLALIVLLTLFGPLLSPWPYDTIDFAGPWSAPPGLAGGHWFGTDDVGRDLFARVCYGGRISLLVGLAATLVSVFVGVGYGAAAGYAGGRVDAWMMRTVDVLYGLPFLFFVILLTVLFGRHLLLIFLAIGSVNWLDMARIVRGQTLSLRRREFVDAAIVAGAGPVAIVRRHIVPNLMDVVVAYATLTVPQVILVESFLSFLGLGVAEPQTSWGALVSDGAHAMETAPWALVVPAAFLCATLLCLNFLGEAAGKRWPVVSGQWSVKARRPAATARASRLPAADLGPLLQVESLQVEYAGVSVVDGVSFTLSAGGTLGVVGESGCGKSQTALALLGLLPSSARVGGSLRLDGRELLGLSERELNRIRGDRIALVFQDPMTSLNPCLSIGTQMAEVLRLHRGFSRDAALAECARMLDAVRIANARARLGQYPHELSGGMRQRVLIATALLCRPALLVADEPTTALDATVQAEILHLLQELQRELRLALLLISHDLDVIAAVCRETLVMYAGRVVESAPTAQLLQAPRHPYTAGLLASRPRLDTPPGLRLQPIPGQPPDPAHLPGGCAFRPRCPAAIAACAVERPALRQLAPGHGCACHAALL